jgi:hypothetical protein
MIEFTTRGGHRARVVGCLPEGEGVGLYNECRLVGVWTLANGSYIWVLAAWHLGGQASIHGTSSIDLVGVPADIEERLASKGPPAFDDTDPISTRAPDQVAGPALDLGDAGEIG